MEKERLPEYSKSQLALRNGQDKPQVWIAYKGYIYDVSDSRLWKNGMHYEHWAGQDLTEELKDAPHSDSVFSRFPVIGILYVNHNL
ncbi:MAG: cytochrome b5 [Sphingobacterium sp.]|jgi:predicted heme/steroid binding protein|uniref:cytochrome b5 domain-containing protein n=1 Tax=Sphingobacterium sp. CZ-UAM TaxID=1933868 RepID=UPI00158E9058|nr:cytochrome b5 domain-containing protein [Sphingobacterium sp. CZ-UAM]MDF2518883.1 cytochrome b5 [Sphingobacterium sp.]